MERDPDLIALLRRCGVTVGHCRCDDGEETDRFVADDPRLAEFLAGARAARTGHARGRVSVIEMQCGRTGLLAGLVHLVGLERPAIAQQLAGRRNGGQRRQWVIRHRLDALAAVGQGTTEPVPRTRLPGPSGHGVHQFDIKRCYL